jgi:hypothetical protein
MFNGWLAQAALWRPLSWKSSWWYQGLYGNLLEGSAKRCVQWLYACGEFSIQPE